MPHQPALGYESRGHEELRPNELVFVAVVRETVDLLERALLELPGRVHGTFCPEQAPWIRRCSVGVRDRDVGMSDSRVGVGRFASGSYRFGCGSQRFACGGQAPAPGNHVLGSGNERFVRVRWPLGLGSDERFTWIDDVRDRANERHSRVPQGRTRSGQQFA